jgi:hypothetical protein
MPITGNSGAPPARPAKASGAAAKPKTTSRTAQRSEAIAGLGQIAQGALIATGQLADAGAVGIHFPGIAGEIARLADADAKVAAIIDPLLKVGPYTALLTAVLPLAMQIAVNHKRIPAGTMGTVPGELLDSQIKTSMARQQLEVKRQQAEVERQLAEMQADQDAAEAAAAA